METGDREGEGRAYDNLGIVYLKLGQFERAVEFQSKYLAISLEVGDSAGEVKAYGILGAAYIKLGQLERGAEFLRKPKVMSSMALW